MPLIGERLKARRERMGLSQKEVAKALKIRHYQQYAAWEVGEHDPSLKYIEKLAKLLNTSLDYLIGLIDDPAGQIRESDLSPDEQKLLELYRQNKLDEAAVYVLSGRLSRELQNGTRLLIESGDKPSVSSPDPAA